MSVTTGSTRRFRALAPLAPERADDVWQAWTDPSTWHLWDRGLSSARLIDPAFVVGAHGEIVDLRGRRSAFVVTRAAADRSGVAVDVGLPLGRLTLTRGFTTERRDEVRHEVAFVGASAPVFGAILGRPFRRQVGPSLDDLLRLVERPGP